MSKTQGRKDGRTVLIAGGAGGALGLAAALSARLARDGVNPAEIDSRECPLQDRPLQDRPLQDRPLQNFLERLPYETDESLARPPRNRRERRRRARGPAD